MQHGDLRLASLHQFFVGKMLVLLTSISWSNLLLVPLFHQADGFLHFMINIVEILAVVRLYRQLFDKDRIVLDHGWHHDIFGCRCILWIMKIDS